MTTERERAAFILGIEYAADEVDDHDELRRYTPKQWLNKLAQQMSRQLCVSKGDLSVTEIDIRRARNRIE